MKMTPEEAFLKVVQLFAYTLTDLALGEDEPEDAVAELHDQMADVAEMLLDTIGFMVVDVDEAGVARAEVHLHEAEALLAVLDGEGGGEA